MKKYYFNTEENEIISLEELRKIYAECDDDRKADGWTFSDYVKCCLTENNGVLIPVEFDSIPDLYEWETGEFWDYEEGMKSVMDENSTWVNNQHDGKYNTVAEKQEVYNDIFQDRFIVINKRGYR